MGRAPDHSAGPNRYIGATRGKRVEAAPPFTCRRTNTDTLPDRQSSANTDGQSSHLPCRTVIVTEDSDPLHSTPINKHVPPIPIQFLLLLLLLLQLLPSDLLPIDAQTSTNPRKNNSGNSTSSAYLLSDMSVSVSVCVSMCVSSVVVVVFVVVVRQCCACVCPLCVCLSLTRFDQPKHHWTATAETQNNNSLDMKTKRSLDYELLLPPSTRDFDENLSIQLF